MYPNYMFYQEDYNFFLEQEEKSQQSYNNNSSSNATATLKQRKHYYYSLQLVQYIFDGYTLVLLLEFINDSMTLGIWIVTKSLIMSFYTRTYLVQFSDVLLFWFIKIILNICSLFCILSMKWILFCVCNEGSTTTITTNRNIGNNMKNNGGGIGNTMDNNNIIGNNNNGKKNNSSSEDSLLLLENGIGTWIIPKIVVLFFE